MASKKPSGDQVITRMGQYLTYLLVRVLEAVLSVLPLTFCARLGHFLGGLGHAFFGGPRRLALRNLEIAFGREKDLAWRKAAAKKHFQSLGANFLCSMKFQVMSEAEITKRVTIEGMEHAQAVVASGKPLLYAICHIGCWELLTNIPSLFCLGRKPATIYQPLSNPYLEAHLRRRREKLGYELFNRSDGFGAPIKHLREAGSAIGVLVDQHAGDKGIWCPFFDRLASTSSLAALMAMRCDAPLLPLAVYNDGLARWKLVIYPPVNSGEKKATAEGLTSMLNIAVEVLVRRAPADWFWVHNRWKTPKPDFLLSKYRRGIVLPKGYDGSRLQPFNLLVRSPNWLGDACMAMPAIRALKQGRPDLRLTIFCQANLKELWSAVPEVDAVVTKAKKEGISSVAKRIRESGAYDAAVLFTNSTRSTLELKRAGIPRLVGYHGSLRSRMLHQVCPEPVSYKPPEHHAYRYLRLAKFCGAKTEDPALFSPTVPPTGAEGAPVIKVGICAGAEYGQAKRWPMDRFAGVAAAISVQWPQVEWQLFGAPGEKAMGETLSQMLGNVPHRNRVGATTLTELIAELRACRLLVTNDTGTMHLAAALGVPTVSIFGSTEPVLTGPLGDRHRIVRHHVPCSPCFKRECPFGHYDCMTGVTAEKVARHVAEELGKGMAVAVA